MKQLADELKLFSTVFRKVLYKSTCSLLDWVVVSGIINTQLTVNGRNGKKSLFFHKSGAETQGTFIVEPLNYFSKTRKSCLLIVSPLQLKQTWPHPSFLSSSPVWILWDGAVINTSTLKPAIKLTQQLELRHFTLLTKPWSSQTKDNLSLWGSDKLLITCKTDL